MAKALCPSCEENVTVAGHLNIGTTIHCSECRAELVVIWLFPLTLGLLRENNLKNPETKKHVSPKP